MRQLSATRQVDFSATDVRVSSRGSATWRRHLTSPSIATQVRWPTSAWLQQHPSARLEPSPVPVYRSAPATFAARSAGGVTFVMAIIIETPSFWIFPYFLKKNNYECKDPTGTVW